MSSRGLFLVASLTVVGLACTPTESGVGHDAGAAGHGATAGAPGMGGATAAGGVSGASGGVSGAAGGSDTDAGRGGAGSSGAPTSDGGAAGAGGGGISAHDGGAGATGGAGGASGGCAKPVFMTSDHNGGWSDGGYYVHNNMWNTAYALGPETLYACSYHSWYVVSKQTNEQEAVKTYPNVHKDYDSVPISSFRTLTSSFAATSASSDA